MKLWKMYKSRALLILLFLNLLKLSCGTKHDKCDFTISHPTLIKPHFWVWSVSTRGANITNLMRDRGWTSSETERSAALIWTVYAEYAKIPSQSYEEYPVLRLINHIDYESSMTNKEHLLVNLRNYERDNPDTELQNSEFMPQGVRLFNIHECIKFFENIEGDYSTWILKPSNMCGGRGIRLVNRSDVVSMLSLREESSCCGDDALERYYAKRPIPIKTRVIVQRYVEHPILIQQLYKSNPRCYIFIASVNPLRVYFHSGLVRYATVPYSDDALDINAHVVAAATASPSSVAAVAPLDEFLEAVEQQVNVSSQAVQICGKGSARIFARECVIMQMRKIVIRVINSTYAIWKDSPPGTFALLGVDFLVDTQGRISLMEIQGDPGHNNVQVLRRKTMINVVGGVLDMMLASLQESTPIPSPVNNTPRNDGWIPIIDLGLVPYFYASS